MDYRIEERVLHFKQPAGTSRGVYTTRKIWLVYLSDGQREGVGECAPLPDLSCDAVPDYGDILNKVCADYTRGQERCVNLGEIYTTFLSPCVTCQKQTNAEG